MFWVTCFTDFESSVRFIHLAYDSPSVLISWWKVRVTALSPPSRIVYNAVYLKPFLSTFHHAYEQKQSQPLSSSAHDNAYSCRMFWALTETFHLKASFYKLRFVMFLTVSFSVGFKLQKGSCRSSGWRRNQSTLEDLQSLAIFGCLVSCPFSDNYWEGQIVKPRWMQVAVVYPFFFKLGYKYSLIFPQDNRARRNTRERKINDFLTPCCVFPLSLEVIFTQARVFRSLYYPGENEGLL